MWIPWRQNVYLYFSGRLFGQLHTLWKLKMDRAAWSPLWWTFLSIRGWDLHRHILCFDQLWVPAQRSSTAQGSFHGGSESCTNLWVRDVNLEGRLCTLSEKIVVGLPPGAGELPNHGLLTKFAVTGMVPRVAWNPFRKQLIKIHAPIVPMDLLCYASHWCSQGKTFDGFSTSATYQGPPSALRLIAGSSLVIIKLGSTCSVARICGVIGNGDFRKFWCLTKNNAITCLVWGCFWDTPDKKKPEWAGHPIPGTKFFIKWPSRHLCV